MDSDCWQEHAVNITLDSMEGALNWIWDLKTTVPRSETCTVEGILKALADQHVGDICRISSRNYCSAVGAMKTMLINEIKWGIAEPWLVTRSSITALRSALLL